RRAPQGRPTHHASQRRRPAVVAVRHPRGALPGQLPPDGLAPGAGQNGLQPRRDPRRAACPTTPRRRPLSRDESTRVVLLTLPLFVLYVISSENGRLAAGGANHERA